MDAWMWIIVIVAVAAVAIAVFALLRTRRLQQRFGPEYERTVEESDGRLRAESNLKERETRRKQFDIKPLEPAQRDRYALRWKDTQARFVDDPTEAIGVADVLIQEVMAERGYPVEDFDRRSEDLSVDHPDVVEDYREAHAVSLTNRDGRATTEDLRRAMVHYRSLFDRLVAPTPEDEDRAHRAS
jgi:hypothetical protein